MIDQAPVRAAKRNLSLLTGQNKGLQRERYTNAPQTARVISVRSSSSLG